MVQTHVDDSWITPYGVVPQRYSEEYFVFLPIKYASAGGTKTFKRTLKTNKVMTRTVFPSNYLRFSDDVANWVEENQEFVDTLTKELSPYNSFKVDVTFYKKYETSPRSWGVPVNVAPDIDNMLKPVFDRITRSFGFDDKQISEVSARKIHAKDDGIQLKIQGVYYDYDFLKKAFNPHKVGVKPSQTNSIKKAKTRKSVKSVLSLSQEAREELLNYGKNK